MTRKWLIGFEYQRHSDGYFDAVRVSLLVPNRALFQRASNQMRTLTGKVVLASRSSAFRQGIRKRMRTAARTLILTVRRVLDAALRRVEEPIAEKAPLEGPIANNAARKPPARATRRVKARN